MNWNGFNRTACRNNPRNESKEKRHLPRRRRWEEHSGEEGGRERGRVCLLVLFLGVCGKGHSSEVACIDGTAAGLFSRHKVDHFGTH